MKNQEDLISVIIPTYKSARFLEKAIRSIIEQTYSNFEIIIVDDTEADDGTKSILDSFHDKRIRYFHPKERLGMVKSLNYAISKSKGVYIARMDADDISHSKRFEKQVAYLKNNKNVGIVGCNAYKIDENDRVQGILRHPSNSLDIKTKMVFNSAFIHPAVMMRKELVEENLYNEDCFCCEDYEFWSRLMYKTEFHNLKEKLFKYRILSNSAMQKQLKRLQSQEYYIKHTSIMKIAYDNALKYFGADLDNINDRYVDFTFAKRIEDESIENKKRFLEEYEEIIRKKTNSLFVNDCLSYQWIKMNHWKFIFGGKLSWKIGAVVEIIKAIFDKIISLVRGRLYIDVCKYRW